VCYTLALFGSASVSYSNKLRGRFLLPIYIPVVTLVVSAAAIPLRRTPQESSTARRIAAAAFTYGSVAVTGMLLVHVTLPLVLESHTNGSAGGDNAFKTRTWHENQAVEYWLGHVPHEPYRLLSNEPDGVAFNSRHTTDSVPRKTTGPYGSEAYALNAYASDLFSPGTDVYIVWIEPNFYDYFYSVDELGAIAQVETLFVSGDGGVYRLRPRSGS
jgi:hypothetical protein